MTAQSVGQLQTEPENLYLFNAVLTPNRSLPSAGFWAVMAAVVMVSTGLGVFFALQGAWPVFGFFGLDIALLYLAFRWNYRAGRLTEIVQLNPDALVLRRVTARGQRSEWHFNPFWVRVELDEPLEPQSRLCLASHGDCVELGAFLSPEERLEFSNALKSALKACRHPAI
ncbi:MAG: DUF2244 domain-containing protein [Alphaproteobacteria bacterium]|nr:DUF2244 domain-containing protein [Alphaproteobacteria bacterium]